MGRMAIAAKASPSCLNMTSTLVQLPEPRGRWGLTTAFWTSSGQAPSPVGMTFWPLCYVGPLSMKFSSPKPAQGFFDLSSDGLLRFVLPKPEDGPSNVGQFLVDESVSVGIRA